jgi:DNA-binding transcriptional LysR family regulator
MTELDLGAIRAFVVVAESRHFGEAAMRLGITQQAVSKRIAKLESDLGTVLLSRLKSGTGLSHDGTLFLPQARLLLEAADRAAAVLRQGERPLRVDVLDTRLVGAKLMRAFYETIDGLHVDVVTSDGLRTSHATLKDGTVDAAFARVTESSADKGLEFTPVWLESAVVLVGAGHPLARRGRVTMADLSGATAWMPGNERGSEWADFWDQAGEEFGIRIDAAGPNFGWEHFVSELSTSTDRIGFVGEQCRLPRHPKIVQLTLSAPRPAYPWSLVWNRRNQHPVLPRLVAHVQQEFRPYNPADMWLPADDREYFSRRKPDGVRKRPGRPAPTAVRPTAPN